MLHFLQLCTQLISHKLLTNDAICYVIYPDIRHLFSPLTVVHSILQSTTFRSVMLQGTAQCFRHMQLCTLSTAKVASLMNLGVFGGSFCFILLKSLRPNNNITIFHFSIFFQTSAVGLLPALSAANKSRLLSTASTAFRASPSAAAPAVAAGCRADRRDSASRRELRS